MIEVLVVSEIVRDAYGDSFELLSSASPDASHGWRVSLRGLIQSHRVTTDIPESEDNRRAMAVALANAGLCPQTSTDSMSFEEAHRLVTAAVSRGLLRLVPVRRSLRPSLSAIPAQASMPLQELADDEPAQTYSWIELVLLDASGQPMADVAYTVTTPDGSTRSGKTDASGMARYDDVLAGECDIEFPEMDETWWERAAAPGG
ncbi:MAG: hypothetical protein AB1Z98_09425 [Nannocystaceae bacterium]